MKIKLCSGLNVIYHIFLSFVVQRLELQACDHIVFSGKDHKWLLSHGGKRTGKDKWDRDDSQM